MAYLILLLLGAIWGASYLFIKVAGASFPPITLVILRTGIASVVLLGIFVVRREALPPLRAPIWKWLVVLSVLNCVVPYTLINWGEHYVSSGLAAVLVGAMPIFTVLFAHFLTVDEKMTPSKITGVILGFLGVVVLFIPDLAGGLQGSFAGGLAVLVAAVSYALATIVARRQLKGTSPLLAPFGQLALATLMLLPASLVLDQPWNLQPTPAAWAALLTLSILGTAFAYLLYFWLIRHAGATKTSLVTFISPVIAVVLGAVFLGESLRWTTLVGLLLIISGVGMVTNLVTNLLRGSLSPAAASANSRTT